MKSDTKFAMGIFMLLAPFVFLLLYILWLIIYSAVIKHEYQPLGILLFGTWMMIGADLCAKNSKSTIGHGK